MDAIWLTDTGDDMTPAEVGIRSCGIGQRASKLREVFQFHTSTVESAWIQERGHDFPFGAMK